MIWLRASIPLTIPLAVIALLWLIPVPPETIPASNGATVIVGRSIGLGLLTLAVLAIAFIFHSLREPARAPREPAPMALARHEFRRGFASGESAAPVIKQAAPTTIVVALPRRRASKSSVAVPPEAPQASIESVTKRLEERAGLLWSRRTAERA
ncbi:MAG TPA: hypothetical protein VJR47_09470 [Stellaceae bacterium]|nr:hypothetical protein [Stellaceae bacterium]